MGAPAPFLGSGRVRSYRIVSSTSVLSTLVLSQKAFMWGRTVGVILRALVKRSHQPVRFCRRFWTMSADSDQVWGRARPTSGDIDKFWGDSGRSRAQSTTCGATSMKIGRSRPILRRVWPISGHISQSSGEVHQVSGELDERRANWTSDPDVP